MIALPRQLQNDYIFNRELKSEGPSICYILAERITGIPVVCKIFDKTAIGDKESQGKFIDTVRKTSTLGFPFIVQYSAIYETACNFFLIRSYYTKPTLAETILQNEVPNEATYLTILSKILAIIQKLQSNGIVNISIHPGNIILNDENTPLITDIYPIENGLINGNKPCSNWRLSFVAPELIGSTKDDCIIKSDEWAATVLLYYVTIGRVPFTTSNVMLLTKEMNQEPVARYQRTDKDIINSIMDSSLLHDSLPRTSLSELGSIVCRLLAIPMSKSVNIPPVPSPTKDLSLPFIKQQIKTSRLSGVKPNQCLRVEFWSTITACVANLASRQERSLAKIKE